MAPRNSGRPVRSLIFLFVMIAVLSIGTWWPGQSSTPKLGLDLRGGTQVTLTPRTTSGAVITDIQLQQAVEIIRQR
ncbi:MAG: protein translocase subunit SecD, partial [Candidatus Nanopelagicales bacterium]